MECNLEKRLIELAERLIGTRCELVDLLCNDPKNIEFHDASIEVCERVDVWGVAVVENPEFRAWGLAPNIKYEGKHLVFKMDYYNATWLYAVLKIHGEPRRSVEEGLRELNAC